MSMDKLYQVNYNGQNLLLTQEGLNLLVSGQKVELSNPAQVLQPFTEPNIILKKCEPVLTANILPSPPLLTTYCVSNTTLIDPVGSQLIPAPELAMPHVVPGDQSQSIASVNGETTAVVNTELNSNGEYLRGNNVSSGNIPSTVITVPPASQNAATLGDVLHLVVMSPDGVERTITIDQQRPSQKAIGLILTQVCRQFGIDEAMEAIVPDIWSDEKSDSETASPVKIIYPPDDRENDSICSEGAGDKDDCADEAEDAPLYITGKLALCDYCGYLSVDFARCQRCHRKFSKNVKAVSDQMKALHSRQSRSSSSHEDKKKCTRKKKIEETECVTILSSDEEDNSKGNDKENEGINSKELRRSTLEKEPIITELTESPDQSHYITLAGGGKDLNELIDSPDVENIQLECRTVRIGSYKVIPNDHVLLSSYGLRIKVDSLKGEPTTLKILRNEIVKVLVHFGNELPVMFYYITAPAGRKVRAALNMSAKEANMYFDPTSSEEIYKRITLLPVQICEESRLFVKSIYENYGLLGELDSSEANDILVRAATKKDGSQPNKKSLNQSASSPSCQLIQTIMIYPPPPMKGGISINTEDYACLGEDQFLNDVIIDFYLKYLVQNVLSEDDRKRTHVLSSFFYKRLTSKSTQSNESNLTAAEKRHARVKGWTKGVNIFAKDFIIIPINESSHWFLAIICFPGLQSCIRMSDNQPIEDSGRRESKSKNKNNASNNSRSVLSTIGETTITVVSQATSTSQTITLEPEGEERDEAEGNDEDLEPNSSDDEGKELTDNNGDLMDEEFPRPARPSLNKTCYPSQEAIKQPCILIFDSLLGASRSKVIATLREYLHVEYKVKHKGSTRDFSKNCVKGNVPKVPQQNNFTDCGLYVLQYVEEFFRNPIDDYRMPLKMQDWFDSEIVSRKRYEIQQLLHKLMDDQGVDRERINLPRLDLRPDGLKFSEEDEEEPMDEQCEEEMEEEEMPEEEEEEEPMDEELEEEEEEVAAAVQPPTPQVFTPRTPTGVATSTARVGTPRGPVPRTPSTVSPRPNLTQPRARAPTQTRGSGTSPTPRMAVRPSVMLEPRAVAGQHKRTIILPSPDVVTIKKRPVTQSPVSIKEIRTPRMTPPQPRSPLPRISSSVEITKKKMRTD